jgi:hypothetical protein
MICTVCGCTKTRVDYFYVLTLEVKNKTCLKDSLDKLIEHNDI